MGAAMVKHYRGDDSDLKLLMVAVPKAFEAVTVEDYDRRVKEFFAEADNPGLKRPYRECGYQPMVELLRYLEADGFATYIASGGDRDFMRPVAEDMYGIPPERIIGSALGITYSIGRRPVRPALQGCDGLLRRRPGEADPDLEPDRATSHPVLRQFQRRSADAGVLRNPVHSLAPAIAFT